MSGWEVSHEREKPKQAMGCGGGVGEGWAPRKPARVTHPALLLDAAVCCQKKQIPQAGLSLCGGGIIGSVKWQRREAMCSCPSQAPVPGSAGQSRQWSRSASSQDGGLWEPTQG